MGYWEIERERSMREPVDKLGWYGIYIRFKHCPNGKTISTSVLQQRMEICRTMTSWN
jgi:hypothetical protein